jgi:hypothetical protein
VNDYYAERTQNQAMLMTRSGAMTRMNRDEACVDAYLRSLGLGDVIYEPDGKVPPDFLVGGTIAVECRRLNQHQLVEGRARGLEEDSIPLQHSFVRMLAQFPNAVADRSWWVFFQLHRPFSPWPVLRTSVDLALRKHLASPVDGTVEIDIETGFRIRIAPTSTRLDRTFMLGGWIDLDSGGWVVSEIIRNLTAYVAEKSRKVAPFRSKYPTWWLVFVDYIGLAREGTDVRQHFRRPVDWDRLILISPSGDRTCEI